MIAPFALGFSIFAAGILILLVAWGFYGVFRRRQRRRLASAFIGEMVAVLREIELQDIEGAVERFIASSTPGVPKPKLSLPEFIIYHAAADKLDCFAEPLPRKMAFFYTRVGQLREAIASLDRRPLADKRQTLLELREMLELANDILYALRTIISSRHSKARRLV
jgi:hypothetical protein